MLHPLFDRKFARWLNERGYSFPPKLIVSFSGGKDSTAMIERIRSWGFPIASILFFDSGWEFPEMYEHVELFQEKTGLTVERVYPYRPFDEQLQKYRWPAPGRRWCSRAKINAINKWINGHYNKKRDYIVHVIGFSCDELDRTDTKEQLKKGQVLYPLISDFCIDPAAVRYCASPDDRLTEKDALKYCLERGYNWGGLYDYFDRVSCFCCPLKPVSELKIIRDRFPSLWNRMLEMENNIPAGENYVTFKGRRSLHDFDFKFENEDKQLKLFA